MKTAAIESCEERRLRKGNMRAFEDSKCVDDDQLQAYNRIEMMMTHTVITCLLLAFVLTFARADSPIPEFSAADIAAANAIQTPEGSGLQVTLFATNPEVQNPVAIDIGKEGRVYVAETFRFDRGTAENRTQSFLLDDDLQVQTLDDRLVMYEKWAPKFEGGMDWFTSRKDQIKLLQDINGDGRVDKTSVFATFGETLDGLVAGVLPWGDDVWVTCIPHLWRLGDADGDGQAEVSTKMHTGFGVRASFFGHDMHGLTVGPDNRLYFSLGDRGYHLTLANGSVLAAPDQGAVFRCRRDGSQLEVVHAGMRNPQELAFDEWGNLFAGDNNCDKGDKSRLVYVIDGGDSGWRMHYQSVGGAYNGGPWIHERMWNLDDALTPLWLTPSVGFIGSGPSGLAYSSVGAWPEKLRNRFYHCNFSGGRGIETFRVEPAGAGFQLVEYESFLAPANVADSAFGYDGRLYAAVFPGNPWAHDDTGQIYTVGPPEMSDEAVALKALAVEDFSTFDDGRLIGLLAHDDQRLRLRAQDELANRKKSAEFTRLASDESSGLLSRIHAIWGLWQIGLDGQEISGLAGLLRDPSDEIRAQAWRVAGDLKLPFNAATLRAGLDDGSARVQYFVVRTIGRVKAGDLAPDLLTMKTSDLFVRQALVIALARIGDADSLVALAQSDSSEQRTIALLALRQLRHPAVANFLTDADDPIALEAARAVHDLNLEDSQHGLAQSIGRAAQMSGELRLPMMRRAIAANRKLGDRAAAERLIELAVGDPNVTVKQLALETLGTWGDEVKRDLVTGEWRPIAAHEKAIAQAVVEARIGQLLNDDQRANWTASVQTCLALGVAISNESLEHLLTDSAAPIGLQELVFTNLARQDSARAAEMATQLLARPDVGAELVGVIHSFLANSDPEKATPILGSLILDESAAIPVRQSAIRALAARKQPAAHEALRPIFNAWRAEKAPAGLLLEIAEAASVYGEVGADEEDVTLRVFHGGDSARGSELFNTHQIAQCTRCHSIGDAGVADAGPNLQGVAARLTHREIYQALIDPSARIAPGFGIVSVTLADGSTIAGTLRSETPEQLEIAVGTDPPVKVAIGDIANRSTPLSAMPPLSGILKKAELRDIIAFLTTLK